MADDADLTNDREALILNANIQCVLKDAAKMPKGEPGECRYCGEESPRLVGKTCARCRDRRGLP